MKRFHRGLSILFSVILLAGTFSLVGSKPASADEIRLGVSPSFYNNIQIAPGQSKTLELSIANQSVYPAINKATAIKTDAFSVHFEPVTQLSSDVFNSLTPAEKKEYIPSEWVTFAQNNVRLNPGDLKTVDVTISVPKNAIPAEYPLLINVVQQNIGVQSQHAMNSKTDKQVNTQFNSSIQVPIFVVAGNTKLTTKYNISSFTVSDKTQSTSVWDLVKDLLSFNSQSWDAFRYKPFKIAYNWGGKQHVVYDLPQANQVAFRNVSTSDSKQLSATKYILIPQGLTDNTPIDKIDFGTTSLTIYSGTKKYTVNLADDTMVNNFKTQITNLTASLNKVPNFGWLLDNIMLNSNSYVNNIKLYATFNIQNTGTKTIVPYGKLQVFNQGNKMVDSSQYGYTIILPGQTKQLMGTLSYDPSIYVKGTYRVVSTIVPDDKQTPVQKITEITMANIRMYILAGVIVALIIVLLILVFVTRWLIKRRKKKNNQKVLHGDKNSNNENQSDSENKDDNE